MGERGDALALTDVGASLARAGKQQTVEDRATQGESTVAEPAMADDVGIAADKRRSVRGANAHPGKVRGPCILDPSEHAHSGEDARCLRTHVLRTRLVARE